MNVLLDKDLKAISLSLPHIIPVAAEFSDLFTTNLFASDPSAKMLFRDAPSQAQKFVHLVILAVRFVHDFGSLSPILRRLGIMHSEIGVTESMYEAMGDAFLATLRHFLPASLPKHTLRSWSKLYRMISDEMIGGTKILQRAEHRTAAEAI